MSARDSRFPAPPRAKTHGVCQPASCPRSWQSCLGDSWQRGAWFCAWGLWLFTAQPALAKQIEGDAGKAEILSFEEIEATQAKVIDAGPEQTPAPESTPPPELPGLGCAVSLPPAANERRAPGWWLVPGAALALMSRRRSPASN